MRSSAIAAKRMPQACAMRDCFHCRFIIAMLAGPIPGKPATGPAAPDRAARNRATWHCSRVRQPRSVDTKNRSYAVGQYVPGHTSAPEVDAQDDEPNFHPDEAPHRAPSRVGFNRRADRPVGARGLWRVCRRHGPRAKGRAQCHPGRRTHAAAGGRALRAHARLAIRHFRIREQPSPCTRVPGGPSHSDNEPRQDPGINPAAARLETFQ